MLTDTLCHLKVTDLEEVVSNKLEGKWVVAVGFKTRLNMGGNSLFSLLVSFGPNFGLFFNDCES